MARVNNCDIPEDLYYAVAQHVWARLVEPGRVRIGVTPAGYALLRNSVVAVDIQEYSVGQAVPVGAASP